LGRSCPRPETGRSGPASRSHMLDIVFLAVIAAFFAAAALFVQGCERM
jgi:hypothetical protein